MTKLPDQTAALISDPGAEEKCDGNCACPAPLRVAIAYDDVPAARRAIGMLERLLGCDEPLVRLKPTLWRMELLSEPRWREEASTDARRADMLVLSLSEPDVVPSTIGTWVSTFLSQPRATSTAILSMFGPDDSWRISVQDGVGAMAAAASMGA